jgi:hypothetical protein
MVKPRRRHIEGLYKSCPHCGAHDIPVEFDFCGRCGTRFASAEPNIEIVVTDKTMVNDILAQSPEAMQVLEDHGIRICGGCIVLLNSSVRQTAEYSGLAPTETSALVEELNEKIRGGQK